MLCANATALDALKAAITVADISFCIISFMDSISEASMARSRGTSLAADVARPP
jgi:hypothetical protein